jgi:hypothetical protein
MRVLLPIVLALPLFGCAADPERDAEAACSAQGHEPGTEAWRHCMEAGGAAIATGPGSPYANVDEEEDSGGDDE